MSAERRRGRLVVLEIAAGHSTVPLGEDDRGKGAARIVAHVVREKRGAPAAEAGRRARVTTRPPDCTRPSAYVALDALPLAGNGKPDRARLPPPAPPVGAGAAPCPAHEETLCALVTDVLGLERVGVDDDDFFELGGHSPLATRLISRVRTALGVEPPIRTMFETPAIAALAERAAGARRARPWSRPRARKQEAE
jgi:hypothetical protein